MINCLILKIIGVPVFEYQKNLKDNCFISEILPEWSMPDSDDVEELGTFDSSGAFVSTKV